MKQRKDSDGEMFLRHNNHEAPLGPSPKPMDFQQAGGSSGFGGETFITSTTTTSTVVSIDAVTRTLQLKQSNGKTTAYKAGPEVANFDQIKIGDLVHPGLRVKDPGEDLLSQIRPTSASCHFWPHGLGVTTFPRIHQHPLAHASRRSVLMLLRPPLCTPGRLLMPRRCLRERSQGIRANGQISGRSNQRLQIAFPL